MPTVINLHVETKWYEKTEPKKKKKKRNTIWTLQTLKEWRRAICGGAYSRTARTCLQDAYKASNRVMPRQRLQRMCWHTARYAV